MPSSPILEDEVGDATMVALKKKAAAYLSDLYNATPPVFPSTTTTTAHEEEEDTFTLPTSAIASTTAVKTGKKRSLGQLNALDLLTQSAAKKIALASGDLPTPLLSDEDFLAQAGALLASANPNILHGGADKPYKCPVGGCDKAYKNPNGLKYHNQHGHCNMTTDDSESMASKPYQCTIGDCGKRYKNLNGLKYHIEHSHMAALNHTLAAFGSSIFNSNGEEPSSSSSMF